MMVFSSGNFCVQSKKISKKCDIMIARGKRIKILYIRGNGRLNSNGDVILHQKNKLTCQGVSRRGGGEIVDLTTPS